MQDSRQESNWDKTQKKLFAMVSTGVTDSGLNQFYDIFSTVALIANLVCAFAATFDSVRAAHGQLLDWVEEITVLFFGVPMARVHSSKISGLSFPSPSVSQENISVK